MWLDLATFDGNQCVATEAKHKNLSKLFGISELISFGAGAVSATETQQWQINAVTKKVTAINDK